MPGTTPSPRDARTRFVDIAGWLHRAVRRLCVVLLAALLGVELVVVLLRYCLGTGFLELQDLAAYLFAALVMLGLPVALADDRHVRVDVLRERQGRRARRRTDRIGVLLFLIPAFALTAWLVLPEVRYAWSIREGSRETGGLGGVWIVKTVLPLACLLMLVQGVASLLRPAIEPAANDVVTPDGAGDGSGGGERA